MQELNSVFVDMCHQLDVSHPPLTCTSSPSPPLCRNKRPNAPHLAPSTPVVQSLFQQRFSTRADFEEEDGEEQGEDGRAFSSRWRGPSPEKVVGGGRDERHGLKQQSSREKLRERRRKRSSEVVVATNAQEMAELLRHWMMGRGNLKVCGIT